MTIRYEAILVDNITPTLQKIKRETDSVKIGFAGLKSVIAGLTAALGTKELIDYTSRWTDLNSRFKNAIGDAAGANDALTQIAQTARSTYSSLEATAETFLRNSQAMKELGFTTQQQVDFSDALNNALAVSGTKGAQAESVMNALSKAMALGKLSGENFNTVISSGGRIAQALADGLGVTTIQLRELAAAGRIDTITMVETLIAQMEKLRQESADMPVTARDGFVLLNNAVFEFVGRLDTAIGSSTGFGEKLQEVADAIISLAQNADQMAKLAIVVVEVGKAIAYLVGAAAAIAGAIAFGKAFIAVWGAMKVVTATVSGLSKAFGLLASAVGVKLTRNNLLTLLKDVPGIGNKVKVVANALDVSLKGVGKAFGVVGAAVGVGVVGFNAYSNIQEKFEEQQKKTNGALQDSHIKLYQQEQAAKAARAEFERLKAVKIAKEFQDLNTQLQLAARGYYENNKQQLDSLRTQNSLMNASAQQIKLSQTLTEAERAYLREKQRIDDALTKARVDASRDDEDARRKALAAIPILEQQLRSLNSAYQDQGNDIKKLVEENEKLIRIKEFDTFATQRQIDLEDQLQKIRDDISLVGLTETAKQYKNIELAANASAKAAIRAEEARRGQPLDPAEQQRYYAEATKGSEQLQKLQAQLTIESRKFSTGWKTAFEEYADNATNAAKQAQAIFAKVTRGMEDLIVNFAKTGKFEFKGFINSVLEDLLRSQVQQLIAQMFSIQSGGGKGGGSLGGSLGGFLGSILGFANGGIIPTNSPVLVGERGPELLTGAAGNRVIPNESLGGTVVYNINAVDAMSFKQMIAQDPSFIHAVAMQGAKGMPSRR